MVSSTIQKLKAIFGERILDTHSYVGNDTAVVAKEALFEIAKHLKEDPELQYNFLMDVTAVDYLKMNQLPRFEVVYHLFSLPFKARVRIKVPLDEEALEVDSLVPLWPGANWFEREVYDMFGIKFKGHPDLRRILLYEEFEGHPLRKDYPVEKRHPLIGPKN